MFHRYTFIGPGLLICLCLLALSSATAAPISAGSGTESAEVVFNWPDGFIADYTVHFGSGPSDTIDGYDATQAAAAADPNLSLTWENFPFDGIDPDYFLNVASYTGGHIGDGDTYDPVLAPDNYWAEWINDGSGWFYGDGASVDLLGNGDQIGWVFGSEATPVPEPATTAAFFLIAALLLIRRRAGRAVLTAAAAISVSSAALAVDSVTVVPGTLTQGTVKASLTGGSYDTQTNNLGDWPLNTGSFGGSVEAISFENPDFNGNSFGGNPNTMIAFGNGGGVTLQFATPITPQAGQKSLGVFTAQAIAGGIGSLFNGDMDAAILVSADDVNWYTLTGVAVASPTTYTGITYPLNAPTMAYDYQTDANAWNDGSGTSQANLNSLMIADFTTPMPDDSLFNSPSATNAQRLALTTDASTADYTETFGNSGGGNWFDISGSGLSQVSYVRLNGDANDPASGGVRLDAVFASSSSGVSFIPEPSSGALISLSSLALLRRHR